MKKEPMHCLGMVSWLVTAIVAIHVGLAHFGYNYFTLESLSNMPWLVTLLMAIVLLSGIMSLVMYVMTLTGKGGCASDCCGSSSNKQY